MAEKWLAYSVPLSIGHVAKKHTKFGVGRFAVSAVLGEGGQKSILRSCQCFGTSTRITLIVLTASSNLP